MAKNKQTAKPEQPVDNTAKPPRTYRPLKRGAPPPLLAPSATTSASEKAKKVKKPLPPPLDSRYHSTMTDSDNQKGHKQAMAEVAKRRPPSHQPGYARKDRVKTVALTAHVPLEVRTAVHYAAKKSEVTTQEFMIAVLAAAVAQVQSGMDPTKIDVAEALEAYREAERATKHETAVRLVIDPR